jgi:hypothetical protein
MFYRMLHLKNFKNINVLATKTLSFITRFLITLSDIIILLIIKLYRLVKPLIKKFSNLITYKEKPRPVLKGYNPQRFDLQYFK